MLVSADFFSNMSALCIAHHRYTLDDFKQISADSNSVLPEDVLETLRLIESQIIIPTEEEQQQPAQSHHHHQPGTTSMHHHLNRRPPQPGQGTSRPHRRGLPQQQSRRGGSSSSVGATAIDFHVTKRAEVAGVDKQFNDIRSMINKLSSKTVEAQKPLVIDAIANFLFGIDDDEVRLQFARRIADILVSNPFLVHVYLDIYTDLCLPEFPYSADISNLVDTVFATEYMTSLRQLQAVVESSDDYDAFCEYNKRNDARKARATFFAEATKRGVFPSRHLGAMTEELLELVTKAMDQDGRVHEIEEITENIALLVAGFTNPAIRQGMRDLSQKKVKEHPSWSSRALFKYMDLTKVYNDVKY